MFEAVPLSLQRAALGFVLGMLLGFAARRGRFCTFAAIEDVVYAHDGRRARAWLIAIGVAMAGLALLVRFAGLDLSRSIYVAPHLDLGAVLIGGLMFGFGMALNGNCGFGTLLRIGSGDLKALVTWLVMGLFAAITMRGFVGMMREALVMPLGLDVAAPSQRLPDMLRLGHDAGFFLSLGLAAVLVGAALASRAMWATPRYALGGAAVGLLIVAGWAATGLWAFDEFDTRRVESFTFAAPMGDTLYYMMLTSALSLDFPVAAVAGVLIGAYIEAKTAKRFRWETPDDAREMKRHLAGAALMGMGGVTALGCTIGQGITGLSTLAVSSIAAMAAILLGARLGLYWLIERDA